MRQRGDYLWTIERKDGQYRALVFERSGSIMAAVARGEFLEDKAQAAEDAKGIIDRTARDKEKINGRVVKWTDIIGTALGIALMILWLAGGA